jgi:hypothetical protein
MATALGPRPPAPLLARLGRDAHDPTLVVPLLTVDEAGFPHVSMLDTCAIVAGEKGALRLAVSGTSATAHNLRRDARATLLVADERDVYYVKLRAEEHRVGAEESADPAIFVGLIEQVLADAPDTAREGRPRLASALRVTLDPSQAASRNALRDVLAAAL